MTTTIIRRSIGTAFVAVIVGLVGLAAVVVASPLLGYQAVVIRGPSMEPALPLGSLVLVNQSDLTATPGSIVTIRRADGVLVTHRVVAVSDVPPTHVHLKGDANEDADPRPVPRTGIVGTVTHYLPFGGFLAFLLQQPSGLVGVMSLLGSFFLAMRLLEEDDAEGAESGTEALAGASRSIGISLLVIGLLGGALGAPQAARAAFGDTSSDSSTFSTAPTW